MFVCVDTKIPPWINITGPNIKHVSIAFANITEIMFDASVSIS